MGFEKALGAVKVIKNQIQCKSQSLLNLARGYFINKTSLCWACPVVDWMFLVLYYSYVSYQKSHTEGGHKVKRKADKRCLFKIPVLER